MWQLFYPRQHLHSIFNLDPEHLRHLGIKGIITDMDNTLVPWNDRSVYPRLSRWLKNLQDKGFLLYIISNSTPRRGKKLAGELGIPAIWYAIKPRRRAFRRAIKEMGLSPSQVAVIGDQIFTDILGETGWGCILSWLLPSVTRIYLDPPGGRLEIIILKMKKQGLICARGTAGGMKTCQFMLSVNLNVSYESKILRFARMTILIPFIL